MKKSYTNHVSDEARKAWEAQRKLDPKKRVCHECAMRAGTVNASEAVRGEGEKKDGDKGGAK